MAIHRMFDNHKLINDNPFPAHLSLYLGGARGASIAELADELKPAVMSFLGRTVLAERLYSNSRGFIAIQCEVSESLAELSKVVLNVCREVQQKAPSCRPHLLERWEHLSLEQQELLRQYGTYKISGKDRHLSIAQVDPRDTNQAFQIAQRQLILPQVFRIASIAFAEIGHRNEKWNVFAEWHSSEIPSAF
jgi:hypothetical protein